jgi:hypothetical protein
MTSKMRTWIALLSMSLSTSMLILLACVSPRGGWDVDVLVGTEPELAALPGQRLGDMLPFPVLEGDRIVLIACRFHKERPVRVRADGSNWPENWGRAAVFALNRSVRRVELVLDDTDDQVTENRSDIEIVMIEAVGGAGPRGLGDTLSECDVSRTKDTNESFRGELIGAEIRMRRAQLDMAGRLREATGEEWVGALMHELAHALGFSGHVAIGPSILVRDEMLIRAAGRRALAGGADFDETLEALYVIRPGTRLGERSVDIKDLAWLEAIRKLQKNRPGEKRHAIGVYSSVGDREARIIWRYSDGSQLGVRLPDWQNELRSGVAITLLPDRTTRQLIAMTGD